MVIRKSGQGRDHTHVVSSHHSQTHLPCKVRGVLAGQEDCEWAGCRWEESCGSMITQRNHQAAFSDSSSTATPIVLRTVAWRHFTRLPHAFHWAEVAPLLDVRLHEM